MSSRGWVRAGVALTMVTVVGSGCGLLEDEPVKQSLADAGDRPTLLRATSELREDLPADAYDCLVEGVDPGGVVAEALADVERDTATEVRAVEYEEAVDVLVGCLGPGAWLSGNFASVGITLDPSVVTCFEDGSVPPLDRDSLAELSLAGGRPELAPATMDALVDLLVDCVPPGPTAAGFAGDDVALVADPFCVSGAIAAEADRAEAWRVLLTSDRDGGLDDTELEQLTPLLSCFAVHPVAVALGLSAASVDPVNCVVDEVRADPELSAAVDAVAAGEAELGEDEQRRSRRIAAACFDADELAEMLLADLAAEGDAGEVQIECLARTLQTEPDRRAAFRDRTDPASPVVADIVDCVPGSTVIERFVTEALGDDPDVTTPVAELADRECADALWRDDRATASEVIALSMLAEESAPSTAWERVAPFLRCVRYGFFLAEAAADEGIELSRPSVECLVDAVQDSDALRVFILGEDAELFEDEVAGFFRTCLTPAELAELAES